MPSSRMLCDHYCKTDLQQYIRISRGDVGVKSVFIERRRIKTKSLETGHSIGHFMLISQICQSSCNLGKSTITCLQSSPSQRHSATHVVSPPDTTASRHSHVLNFPASAQPDNFFSRTPTLKWDVEHVRRCPVIARVNDVFIVSGTHLWMTSPDIQQACRGCGSQRLSNL